MSIEKTYNGWTNYETWLVKLWIDNSEGDQEFFRGMTSEIVKSSAVQESDVADALKNYFEENTPTTEGVYADLLNAAMSEVNWYEIAEALLADVKEAEEDETEEEN